MHWLSLISLLTVVNISYQIDFMEGKILLCANVNYKIYPFLEFWPFWTKPQQMKIANEQVVIQQSENKDMNTRSADFVQTRTLPFNISINSGSYETVESKQMRVILQYLFLVAAVIT